VNETAVESSVGKESDYDEEGGFHLEPGYCVAWQIRRFHATNHQSRLANGSASMETGCRRERIGLKVG
jgi:hypothetical protein